MASYEPVTAHANREWPDAGELQVSLELLRSRLRGLDEQLVELVATRTSLARQLGELRTRLGAPRVVHTDELAVLRRFRELDGGSELATILLRLGR